MYILFLMIQLFRILIARQRSLINVFQALRAILIVKISIIAENSHAQV